MYSTLSKSLSAAVGSYGAPPSPYEGPFDRSVPAFGSYEGRFGSYEARFGSYEARLGSYGRDGSRTGRGSCRTWRCRDRTGDGWFCSRWYPWSFLLEWLRDWVLASQGRHSSVPDTLETSGGAVTFHQHAHTRTRSFRTRARRRRRVPPTDHRHGRPRTQQRRAPPTADERRRQKHRDRRQYRQEAVPGLDSNLSNTLDSRHGLTQRSRPISRAHHRSPPRGLPRLAVRARVVVLETSL